MTLDTDQRSATVTVTLPGDALRQLANVALFADTGKGDPLGVVHLDHDGTTLTAVATNRYLLGAETVTPSQPTDPFTVNLDVAALRPVLKWRDDAPVTLTVGDGSVTFDNGTELARVPSSPMTFPSWRRLWPGENTSDREPLPVTFGVSPKLLATIGKVRPEVKGAPVRLTVHTPLKPIVAEIGDTFRALVMPVKFGA